MEEKDYTTYNEEEQQPQSTTFELLPEIEVQPEEAQTEEAVQPEEEAQTEEMPLSDEKQEKQEKHKLWSSIFIEGETLGEGGNSARELIMGMHVDAQWVLRQIPLLIIVLLGTMSLVTVRYMAQQEIIEKARLENEVNDWKYRSLTRSSELTEQTRQSQIESLLKSRGDSTLTPATEPPFTLNKE